MPEVERNTTRRRVVKALLDIVEADVTVGDSVSAARILHDMGALDESRVEVDGMLTPHTIDNIESEDSNG